MAVKKSTATGRRKPRKPVQRKPRMSRRAHIFSRLALITVLIIMVSIWISVKAFRNAVIDAPEWNRKADSTLSATTVIQPKRGDILAADGSILATNLNYYDVSIDFRAQKFKVLDYSRNLDRLADTLAHYFPQRTVKEWKEHLQKPLEKPRSKRSRSYRLLRAVPFDKAEMVRHFPFFELSKNANKTGLKIEPVLVRRYPYGEMAALSIGRVGELPNGQKHGVSGLEYALDSLLYGKTGVARKVLFTNRVAPWVMEPAQNGYTLTTTIDVTMQDLLEYELDYMLRESDADWGTAILMEVKTGDIKAISNLERDTVPGTGRYIEAMNRAVQGFEPGSVMKAISMTVALEDGVNIEQVYDTRPFVYKGKMMKDTHSPSTLKVKQFMEYSSNIGMVKLIVPHYAVPSDPGKYHRRLEELGLFEKFNTGIANEQIPYFPLPDYKRGGYLTIATQAYGYTAKISPLYLCGVYNAIANDGKFVRPRLVSAMRLEDGTDSILPVTYVRERWCSPENAAILRQMFHDVVYNKPGGTAWRLPDKDDPVEYAGKSGTARVAAERDPRHPERPYKPGYIENAYRYAWAGFFPYDHPKYTLVVLTSNPRTNRAPYATGGMVMKRLVRKMYSRGMLDNTSDYRADANPGTAPEMFVSNRPDRRETVRKAYNIPSVVAESKPAAVQSGRVPDVYGMGLREALVTLEAAGYEVSFTGTGYVKSSQPQRGTPLPKGRKVRLQLTQEAKRQ